jgi:hypothetical protein
MLALWFSEELDWAKHGIGLGCFCWSLQIFGGLPDLRRYGVFLILWFGQGIRWMAAFTLDSG